ncbi:MAG: 16S rRNA (adenine(1518)-N(6)/adenine(1519)-N(6))-dimethyltransferase RsmA [Lachnospiraceae bacterium]|nr:16S rRNA (adenine(1518)-N(6)/adenine(1519)-N(6))-dimethyltransferase RsmA [Lachnospiraceae bacterium]
MKDRYLADNTRAVMERYNFTASKRFGQNFIKDRSVLEDIVTASKISKEDIVLEIGPGIGVLTEFLSEAAGRVYAVEVDRGLIPILQETLKDCENVELVNEDIMKTDITALTGGAPFRVVANLPYYITTPIVMSLLESDLNCRSLTVMVQKEVGERMTASPKTKDYGALTLAVGYRTKAAIVRKVPAGCFIPAPKVDSVVVHMDVYEEPPLKAEDEKFLFSVIRGAFNQRRKTLLNALSGHKELGLSREMIKEAIEKAGEKPAVRGEELSLEQFTKLSDILYHLKDRQDVGADVIL